jgi:hypothetical protein
MAVDSVLRFTITTQGAHFRVGFLKPIILACSRNPFGVKQDLIPDFLQTFLPVPSKRACSSLVASHKFQLPFRDQSSLQSANPAISAVFPFF